MRAESDVKDLKEQLVSKNWKEILPGIPVYLFLTSPILKIHYLSIIKTFLNSYKQPNSKTNKEI